MSRIALVELLVALAVLSCATDPPWKAMVAGPIGTPRRHPFRIRVESSGLRDEDWGNAPWISNEDFHTALVESIRRSGLFTIVAGNEPPEYVLDVFIHVERAHRDAAVNAAAKWTLSELGSRRILFTEIVRSYHRASLDEVGNDWTARVRVAHQIAAQNNIAAGILKLSELAFSAQNLPGEPQQ
jgi:hypothetical protein